MPLNQSWSTVPLLVGMPLKVAAKVDEADRSYYETNIKKLLQDPLVEFLGEIGDADKSEFLGNAYALLFPVDWPEPFGIVMIESLACGTPVIAFRCGSVSEVVTDGENGFVVNSVEEAVKTVKRIGTLRRGRCRQIFERYFTSARMTADYLDVYSRLLMGRPRGRQGTSPAPWP